MDWVADLRAATPTAAAEHATESVDVLLKELAQTHETMRYVWSRYWTENTQKVDSLMREIPDPAKSLRQANERLTLLSQSLSSLMRSQWFVKSETVRHLSASLINPASLFLREKERHDRISKELVSLIHDKLNQNERARQSLMDLITEISPQAILKKGYSYVTASDGTFVKSAESAVKSDNLQIHWHDGQLEVHVKK